MRWILLIACLVCVPLAFVPPQTQDSFWIDVVWLDQFADQLRAGHLYPRWLPEAHGGNGSPTFYFYPPLAFYLAAIPNLLGISDYASVVIAFGLGSAFQGWAMLRLTGDRFLAVVFMLLPYTLYDFYTRGALAEFVAIGWIPLIYLGLTRRPALLPFAYAGMIATHLPLALLASLFLIAPHLAVTLWKREDLRPKIGGLALGILLAGLYLFPALALEGYRKGDELYRSAHFDTSAWNVLRPERWPSPVMTDMIVFGTLLLVGALLKRDRWSLATAALVGVSLGVFFWNAPLLWKVQFPWRTLPLAGFALCMAFRAREGLLDTVYLGLLCTLGALTVIRLEAAPLPALDFFTRDHKEVSEYLPPGTPGIGEAEHSQWAIEQDRPFHFPSLGQSSDGVFLDGQPTLRTLPIEWVGLASSLFALLFLAWRRRSRLATSGSR